VDATHVSLPQRLLDILEGLLRIPAGDLQSTLIHACDLIAAAMGADKIDAFLYDASRDSLVAVGTSNQPLSALQRKLGLDVLPLSNGGRVVHVYKTGKTFLTGDLQSDPEELRGVKEGLKIQSKVGVPLEFGEERRGMIMIASLQADRFSEEDARMAENIGRWTGLVAHRAELAETLRSGATEQGRRAGAEELVTVLAHDLRNYIQPVTTRLATLRHRAETLGAAGMLEDVETMSRAMDRLQGLISDILDVARLDRGLFDLRRQPVDLGTIAREVVAVFSTSQHPVHLSVQQGDPVMVQGDPARLRQCMENLIANASQKSGQAPVTVVVQSEVQANGEAFARVDVVDEGPGIPEEMLPTLFDRFTTSRVREGGLGLGLYLAKRIVAAHGGDITAHSEPRQGARFTLRLPAGSGEARSPAR
jgi:two-component system OmpR family sensor kinase